QVEIARRADESQIALTGRTRSEEARLLAEVQAARAARRAELVDELARLDGTGAASPPVSRSSVAAELERAEAERAAWNAPGRRRIRERSLTEISRRARPRRNVTRS